MSNITSIGFSACICEGWNQLGLSMASACNTHVDAFWSNKDQNGVTRAKSTSTRNTERTPAIASAERDHSYEREAGADNKSEFRHQQERSERRCHGDRGEDLASDSRSNRAARNTQERMRI